MDLSHHKPKFEEALGRFQDELSKLRTGRANPKMLEFIKVDYYGTLTGLNALGTVTVPEPRQLLVQVWDKNALAPVEKAIRESDLGLNPTNEGDKLRIVIPALTEERRRELIKVAGKLAEEARIKVRNLREGIWKDIKKQEEDSQITEDERKRAQDNLQKLIDDYNAKIKDIMTAKEKEMMTV